MITSLSRMVCYCYCCEYCNLNIIVDIIYHESIINVAYSTIYLYISLSIGAFGFLIFIFVEWFVTFFIKGIDLSRVSFFSNNQSQVLGTIIFNYAFVITVPSWINEKVTCEYNLSPFIFLPCSGSS